MRLTFLAILALALIVPTSACDDSGGGAETARLSLMLTDEEGDFTQAQVVIDRIELVGGGQPLVLRDDPFPANLLELANDVATMVADYPVPARSYNELRLIIPQACIAVEQEGGSEKVYASGGFAACGQPDGTLTIPSLPQTGIKVNLPGGLLEVEGEQKILLLDFDVSQSFGPEAGASGGWIMHPVIRADDITFSGSLVVDLTAAEGVDLGAVGGSLSDFQARLTGEAVPQGFVDPDGDGTYTAQFLFLMPGTGSEVSVELQEGVAYGFVTDPISPQPVTILSGAEMTVAFEVTEATPPS